MVSSPCSQSLKSLDKDFRTHICLMLLLDKLELPRLPCFSEPGFERTRYMLGREPPLVGYGLDQNRLLAERCRRPEKKIDGAIRIGVHRHSPVGLSTMNDNPEEGGFPDRSCLRFQATDLGALHGRVIRWV